MLSRENYTKEHIAMLKKGGQTGVNPSILEWIILRFRKMKKITLLKPNACVYRLQAV